MIEPIAYIARTSAEQLVVQFGPNTVIEVEDALEARRGNAPEQFTDPISVASLIVSVAALAWTVLNDLKKGGKRPEADEIIRAVRLELESRDMDSAEHNAIMQTVVSETVTAAESVERDE